MPVKKPFAALALTVASTLALVGCAATGDAPSDTGGISVVATTTQLADFAREVAGEAATVTGLLKSNTSAHGFDPSPADLITLGSADVLVMNGGGLEPWLDAAVSASGFAGTVIDSSDALEERIHAAEEQADAAHPDEEPAATDAAEGAEADHDHADGDPHYWTSIRNASVIVRGIIDALERADASNAEDYRANGQRYLDRLEGLDEWAAAQFSRVPEGERLLVTNHDSLGWFAADYGITVVGAVIPGFDDSAEIAAADIDRLVAAIRESGAKAVFAEASLSPKAAQRIADEAGVRVFTGEDALIVDSLGPAGSATATYLSAQAHNVTVMMRGFGVEADAVPSDLGE